MNKLTNLAGNGLVLILIVINILLLYWMVFPVDPIKYSNIKILTPIVKVGDKVVFEVTLEKKTVYPATISRTLVSCDTNRVYPLLVESGALPPGKIQAIFTLRIPDIVVPGVYHIKSIATYEVNPLSNVTVGFKTPCFEVVK